MTGLLRLGERRGRLRPVEQQLGGLSLLTIELYAPDGKQLEKGLRRAERLLRRRGISRVILPEGFPGRELWRGLRPVEPDRFYRDAADILALEWLSAVGLPARHACVALSAPRLSGEVRAAAERLSAHVRALVLRVPDGGGYARQLQARFGLPAMPPFAPADVVVAFSPGAEGGGAVLPVFDGKAGGMRLWTEGLSLPPDCEQAVLALLWEAGRLDRSAIRATFSPQTLANRGTPCYNNGRIFEPDGFT